MIGRGIHEALVETATLAAAMAIGIALHWTGWLVKKDEAVRAASLR